MKKTPNLFYSLDCQRPLIRTSIHIWGVPHMTIKQSSLSRGVLLSSINGRQPDSLCSCIKGCVQGDYVCLLACFGSGIPAIAVLHRIGAREQKVVIRQHISLLTKSVVTKNVQSRDAILGHWKYIKETQ